MKLKHYLIPSENNDYQPWIASTTALAVFCITVWALRIFLPAATNAASGIDPYDLMAKINLERTQRFIPSLITNNSLITAAQGKGDDMLARSYFAHIDPDGNYVWPRIEAAGYTPYLTLGENLAMDFSSADSTVSAWMNSPTHRANIVNEKFEDQGMGVVAGTFEPGHNTIIAVNLFGTIYKSKTTPPPPPPVVIQPPPPIGPTPKPPPPPAVEPSPNPNPTPSPTTTIPKASGLEIDKNIKIDSTSISGRTVVNLDVSVKGDPTLVTAHLKSQSITLLVGKTAGLYSGSFTYDPGTDLAHETLTVEARDKSGVKLAATFPVAIDSQGVTGRDNPTPTIPISNESQVIKILRIIFGMFAVIYMGFLIVDAIIVHRAKIQTPGIHTGNHALLFLLIASVSLFV